MKMYHPRSHWIMVALVLAAFLLTLSEAYGQATGAAAAFEGRPAMAGAQGGLGAQGGMPQGGLGVQGSDAAERSLSLRKPSGLDQMQQVRREGGNMVGAADKDPALRKDIAPARDKGLAKDQRSAVKKVKRGAKRTIDRSRHGVSPIDSDASATPK